MKGLRKYLSPFAPDQSGAAAVLCEFHGLKLTPARILVIFVTVGAILGGLGLYKYLIDFAGAGATVPLTGFGANLAKGALESVKEVGLLGAFIGGVKANAGGIAAAIFFGYLASLIAKPKIKKQ